MFRDLSLKGSRRVYFLPPDFTWGREQRGVRMRLRCVSPPPLQAKSVFRSLRWWNVSLRTAVWIRVRELLNLYYEQWVTIVTQKLFIFHVNSQYSYYCNCLNIIKVDSKMQHMLVSSSCDGSFLLAVLMAMCFWPLVAQLWQCHFSRLSRYYSFHNC